MGMLPLDQGDKHANAVDDEPYVYEDALDIEQLRGHLNNFASFRPATASASDAAQFLRSTLTLPAEQGRPLVGLFFGPCVWLFVHYLRALWRTVRRSDRGRGASGYVPLLVRAAAKGSRAVATAVPLTHELDPIGLRGIVEAAGTEALRLPRSRRRMLAIAALWVFANVQIVRFGSKFLSSLPRQSW